MRKTEECVPVKERNKIKLQKEKLSDVTIEIYPKK